MAKKVLSIEVSYPVTKVAEVDFKTKKSKVYQCFGIKTPSGTFEDGFLVNIEEFAKTLKEELTSRGIKTKQAVFTITSSRIANREVMIPAVKIKQIGALVQANAADYFPVELSGYQIAYKVMDTVESEGAKQHKLLVVAMPKALIETYNSLAAAVGLKVAAIDYSGNSILPIAKAACGIGVSMLIKVDEHTTQLTIMKDGKSVLQRNVQSGADIAVETMQDLSAFGRDLSYSDALELLRGKTCIRKSFDASMLDEDDLSNDDEKYMLARIALTDSLRGLVSSITRVIDYYNSRNAENQIEKYFLTGFGGDFSGLSKLMSTEVGAKVSVLSHIDGVNLNRSAASETVSLGEYLSCIGAAISPVEFVVDNSAKAKKGSSLNIDLSKVNFTIVAIVVCVVGIGAAIGMSVYSYLKLMVAREENIYLKSSINELVSYEIEYEKYEGINTLYNDVTTMYEMTESPNERLLAFLTELEDKMPSSIAISSFTSSTEDCVMSINVRSKEDVGTTIQNLRSFATVGAVEFAGASERENENAETSWEFTITITYCDPPEGYDEEYSDYTDYDSDDYSDDSYEEESEDASDDDEEAEGEEIEDEASEEAE